MNKRPDDEKLWALFRESFDKFVVGDIRKCLRADIEVGTIILTASGIDCLGGYYAGCIADTKTFTGFIADFMPVYGKYADDIYGYIRNGLVHDYVTKTKEQNGVVTKAFLLTRNHGEPHLVEDRHVLYFNRESFAMDFLDAQVRYFDRAENEQSLWDNAMARIHKAKDARGFLVVGYGAEIGWQLKGIPPSTGQSNTPTYTPTGVMKRLPGSEEQNS